MNKIYFMMILIETSTLCGSERKAKPTSQQVPAEGGLFSEGQQKNLFTTSPLFAARLNKTSLPHRRCLRRSVGVRRCSWHCVGVRRCLRRELRGVFLYDLVRASLIWRACSRGRWRQRQRGAIYLHGRYRFFPPNERRGFHLFNIILMSKLSV